MHELPVVREILQTALSYAEANDATELCDIVLGIGELHDIAEEWVQRYFEYAAKDTIAASAKIHINRYPVVCRCKHCEENSLIHLDTMEKVICPVCGGEEYDIVSGRELRIEHIRIT